jgi:hypothetical protein
VNAALYVFVPIAVLGLTIHGHRANRSTKTRTVAAVRPVRLSTAEMRALLVAAVIAIVGGVGLLLWGLDREYRDNQRSYALLLGPACSVVGVLAAAGLAIALINRRRKRQDVAR